MARHVPTFADVSSDMARHVPTFVGEVLTALKLFICRLAH